MRRVLCDTCALIWLATGDAKLSRMARTVIRDAELLCFSLISIWVIARKVKAVGLTPSSCASTASPSPNGEPITVGNMRNHYGLSGEARPLKNAGLDSRFPDYSATSL